ncbi:MULTISPECIES: hypothetical protein [unclassified Bacillus (in: firmicutes)]|uniref:hypothetical protein n=1 Tax=unclassified Bacillus (in: firmicutes) TaxID=185979 RepID=UPI00040F38DE|nr:MULTISPECIES: hypothetical protein [unclassified Bacillus (in: firmicutes)]QHZ47989.1 hypothetical protein M654_017675 [Bacillus sp. NSP9.1]WFA04071.1 hypothetical protein P3X63_15700 [Bacillus sp. HSf4]
MKTFMSAAHCFLMYGFLAYLLLLFMTEVIDRSPFTNSFLKGGAIFIGMLLFSSLVYHLKASLVKTNSSRITGIAAFLLVMAIHFYVVPLC